MTRLLDRCTGALIGALALAVIALAAGMVDAGPLDPTTTPAPTGRPVDELDGAWNRTLATNRFIMFGSQGAIFLTAVLDRETNLVWERSPSATQMDWFEALHHCAERIVMGNRHGWRLPTVAELTSLVDTARSDPALPLGHPFTSVQSGLPLDLYWSSETHPANENSARQVSMAASGVSANPKDSKIFYAWCVRGNDPAAD